MRKYSPQENQKNVEKRSSESRNAPKFKAVLSAIFKIATVLLFILIVVLICIDFFDTTKNYISYEIIVALCLVVIIVCLDSFDCFQIGNILRLEREKKIIESDNKLLRDQYNTLVGIVSSIQNNVKVENNFNVTPGDDKQKTQEDTANEIDTRKLNTESTAHIEQEELLSYIKERLQKDMLAKATIIWNPILGSGAPHAHPHGSFFDLYIKQNNVEEFIEIKYLVPSFGFFDLIDRQLSAVANYNYINNRDARYVLIICNTRLKDSDRLSEINSKKYKRLLNEYAEAIDAGLMKVIMR